MKIEELIEELKLNEEQTEIVKKFQQSTEDTIRTDYSKKLKDANDELTKYKPVERTAEQIELENVKSELSQLKFKNDLQTFGIGEDLAHFLDKNMNLEDFKSFHEGYNWSNLEKSHVNLLDFVPNTKNSFDTGITKEQFRKMGISDRTKLYNSSPELYDQLSK